MSKIIELAKKLKALSERGIGGEKTNAIDALNKLIQKHSISAPELESEEIISKVYGIKFDDRHLFFQVIASISEDIKVYGYGKSKTNVIVECTNAQFIEIDAKFNFFLNDYITQVQLFFEAYIQKNRLFKSGAGKFTDELSVEELQRMRKVLKMGESVDTVHFNKQLKN